MKPGDLVRYRKWPHEELHASGITGLVLSDPYEHPLYKQDFDTPVQIDVWWTEERSSAWGNSNITWEYVDEIEVLNASD